MYDAVGADSLHSSTGAGKSGTEGSGTMYLTTGTGDSNTASTVRLTRQAPLRSCSTTGAGETDTACAASIYSATGA